MSDDKNPPILICMPWSQRDAAKHDTITKALCAVCQGEVFYNTRTGLPKGETVIIPLCGACAVDLIDSDAAKGEHHQFALTEPQRTGQGGVNAEVLRIVKKIGMDELSKIAINHIRNNRARYDASPSKQYGAN